MPKENLIINGHGDSIFVGVGKPDSVFPDKKPRDINTQAIDNLLIQSRDIYERFEIGQREATFYPNADFHNLPVVFVLMTDTHYGSIMTNTELLNEHLDIIRNTPNFFIVHNGDHTDNFNATGKWASGMMEDPLPPKVAARTWAKKLTDLDQLGKIGVLGFGNHDDFGSNAGQDYHDTFLSGFRCPIFTSGGLLHIIHGTEHYALAMSHKYWGTSKLNPTNACKRYLEHEEPTADLIFLGHTHQSEGLTFERGGKKIVAVIGGTYKDRDDWARKQGIAGRSGSPGWAVALYPNEHKMKLYDDLRDAQKEVQLNMETYGH